MASRFRWGATLSSSACLMARFSVTASITQSQSASSARSSSKLPTADARGIGGIVKRRRLAFFQGIERLRRDGAARGAFLGGNIQKNHGQPGIGQVRRDARSHGAGAQHGRFADHGGGRAIGRRHSGRSRTDSCFNAHANHSSLETMRTLLLRFLATRPCVKVRANWLAISSAGKGAVRLIPHTDPVQRAGDGKRGDLGIARRNGAIGDAFLDEGAQAAVDFSLVGSHFGERVAGKVALVQPHHAAAEVDRHDVGVGIDEGFHFLQAGAAVSGDIVENLFDQPDCPGGSTPAGSLPCCRK